MQVFNSYKLGGRYSIKKQMKNCRNINISVQISNPRSNYCLIIIRIKLGSQAQTLARHSAPMLITTR